MQMSYLREMSGEAFVFKVTERLPAEQVQSISLRLSALPEVDYAEPDLIMQPMLVPNDTQYGNQWHYFTPSAGNYGINAPPAWDITTGASNIVAAVVDTGITEHTEFNGRTVPGYDFIFDALVANDGNARDNDPRYPGDWITEAENDPGDYFEGCPAGDSSWHGTHTAGTIGAASNNNTGVAGVNWTSKILPVRVLGKCGGYTSDVVDGMRWAAGLAIAGVPANANPAEVINVSLGRHLCSAAYQNAVVHNRSRFYAGCVRWKQQRQCRWVYAGELQRAITVAATDRDGSRPTTATMVRR
jgi:serine protease